MSATPTSIILFVIMLLTALAIGGPGVFETGTFVLMFLLYVPAYFGALCWQDARRMKKETRRKHSRS